MDAPPVPLGCRRARESAHAPLPGSTASFGLRPVRGAWRRGEPLAALQRGRPDARPPRPARLLSPGPRRSGCRLPRRSSSRTTPRRRPRARYSTATQGPAGATSATAEPVHARQLRACGRRGKRRLRRRRHRQDDPAPVRDRDRRRGARRAACGHRHVAQRGLRPGRRGARPRPRGASARSSATTAPALYDPAAELAARFANTARRGLDPVHYVRGKIVFGAFSRALLERIRARTGRVFHPLAPDYTSMVPACVLADRATRRRPAAARCRTTRVRSNGQRQGANPRTARRFIESVDPAIVDALPIPGLYTSVHNVVAYDLVSAAARLPAGSTPRSTCRISSDAPARTWTASSGPTPRSATQQLALLRAAEERHGVDPEAAPAAGEPGHPRDQWQGSSPACRPRADGGPGHRRQAAGDVRLAARRGTRGGPALHPAGRVAMKAVILAGGRGSRLSEETIVRPKPMVEIGGRPILWHIMRHLRRPRDRRLRGLRGLQGLRHQGVLRQLLPARLRRHVRPGHGRRSRSTSSTRALARDARRHRPGDDDRRPRAARARAPGDDETFLLTYGDGVADIDVTATVELPPTQRRAGDGDRRPAAGALRRPGARGRAGHRASGEAASATTAGSTAASSCSSRRCSTASTATTRVGAASRCERSPATASSPPTSTTASGSRWTRCGTRAPRGLCGRAAARPGRCA